MVVEVDPDVQRAVYEFLQRNSPPERWREALLEWERAEGASFVPVHPPDPQLEVACALLAGRRPGPERLARVP